METACSRSSNASAARRDARTRFVTTAGQTVFAVRFAGWSGLTTPTWDCERRGGKRGRGVPGKHRYLAAAQTTEEGHPVRSKCSAGDGVRNKTVAQWAAKLLPGSCHLISDGLSALYRIEDAGIAHTAILTGGGAAGTRVLAREYLNTILGILVRSIHSSYRTTRCKHLPRLLPEFHYQCNCRFDLAKIVDKLIRDVVRTPPLPEQLNALADVAR